MASSASTQEQVLGDDEVRKHIEFVVHESDARIPDLLADKVDVNFQFMTVTAGRALQVAFTFPYYREGVGLLFLKDSPNNSRADLEGKGANISILQNVYSEEIVHRGVSDANVQQFDSVASAIEALDSGRVDAAASDLSTLAWLAKNNGDKYKADTERLGPELVRRLDQAGRPDSPEFRQHRNSGIDGRTRLPALQASVQHLLRSRSPAGADRVPGRVQ